MSEKEFLSSFFQWRIPKSLRFVVMKEMEKEGLLKREKKKVFMNNYYISDKVNGNGKVKYKDKDTKNENPYLSIDKLKDL